jgi:endonuclease/exonuclease/phosphatase family metal-dependent hydrolase
LAAATGWDYGAAHLAVNVYAAVGAVVTVWVAGWSTLQRWYWALVGGSILVLSLAFLMAGVGPGWLWVGLVAINSWAALGEVLTSTARSGPLRSGLWRSSLVTFVTLSMMLALIIAVIGYSLLWMTAVAGAVLSLAAFWATRVEAGRDRGVLRDRLVLVGGGALGVLVTVALWVLLSRPPQADEMVPIDRPLRVMTYNIHHGLDAGFGMDLEAIVDVIAAEDPDVVVLNEVNRARLTNGFVDTLLLVSKRLDMPYVFGPNLPDGQYGNAILSRYPILEWENIHYTRNTTEVRGLLRAVIQAGTQPITFLATHLDHIEGPEHVRAEQVREALDQWMGDPRVVLLGDLNAEPDAPELQGIYDAGFQDVLAVTGQDDAFTFWEPEPSRRLDFIFLTPDLPLVRAWVVPSRASDHLPVLAEVGP